MLICFLIFLTSGFCVTRSWSIQCGDERWAAACICDLHPFPAASLGDPAEDWQGVFLHRWQVAVHGRCCSWPLSPPDSARCSCVLVNDHLWDLATVICLWCHVFSSKPSVYGAVFATVNSCMFSSVNHQYSVSSVSLNSIRTIGLWFL